jgi:chromate transporter
MEPRAESGPASPRDLFVAFTSISLQGFGGVLPVAERVLCDQRRWLTRAQFVELLSLGQVIPGPNLANVAVMLGDRAFGLRGALAAVAGLVAAPLAIMLSVAGLYGQYGGHPAVAGALRGLGATSAGLIAGTALKLAGSLRQNRMGLAACAALGAAAFALVAFARVPLAWVLLVVGSAGVAIAWRRRPMPSDESDEP